MSTNTSDIAAVVVATVPMFAAGVGIDANPIAAGISGAALASVFKLGPIDQADFTAWKGVEIATKFAITFFAGVAATVYGSPYACSRLGADVEARVLVYLLVGLVGSIAIRLVASNDRQIIDRVWAMISNLKPPTNPPTNLPPAPPAPGL